MRFYPNLMRGLWTLLFSLALGSSAQSQDNSLLPDGDTELLVTELGKILSMQNNPDAIATLEEFKKNIKARKITDEHYRGIIELGNPMIMRKMRRYNYFKMLIATVNSFSDDAGLTGKHFGNWIRISLDVLNDLPEGNFVDYENYLKFCESFWADNVLYKIGSGSHIWMTDNKEFDFRYIEKKVQIKYSNINLYCYQRSDSMTIYNTSGTYYPLNYEWKGKGGRVEWGEALPEVYAELKEYNANFKTAEYSAEEVTLFYLSLLKKPVKGSLRDRITRRSKPEIDFPRFKSAGQDIKMDDIGGGVTYYGGFLLYGKIFRGSSAMLEIRNSKGQQVVRAAAPEFEILRTKDNQQIIAQQSDVSIYLYSDAGRDSIYHPAARFIYYIDKKQLRLERGDSRSAKAPFFNSVQKVEMHTPGLTWDIEQPDIDIEGGSIASENYFDVNLYEKYAVMGSYNGLTRLANYVLRRRDALNEERPEDKRAREEAANTTRYWLQNCEAYPNDCPYTKEELENMAKTLDRDNLAKKDPESLTTFSVNELAAIFDKRLEHVVLCNQKELDHYAKTPKVMAIRNEKELTEFRRNHQKKYDYGALHVMDIDKVLVNPPSNFNVKTSMGTFLEMNADGFGVYNSDDSTFEVRPKLFHYLNSSKKGSSSNYDYDRISVKNNKAKFNVESLGMETNGVRFFVLSDSQNVRAQPTGPVNMKRGRDMDFNGQLRAGFLKFDGQSFHFYYDLFQLELDTINEISIEIYERERYGEESPEHLQNRFSAQRVRLNEIAMSTKHQTLGSVIENVKGVVEVDWPNNKSGRNASLKKGADRYPSFESIGKSRVHYDRRNHQDGKRDLPDGTCYPRDLFYYELEPFRLEPLDAEDFENQLRFAGRLFSADIFPEITDSLRLIYYDVSLGLETRTPKDGYPVYNREEPGKGKGHFYGIFGLSNEGLIGNGRLEYLGAKVESEYIEFLPESFHTDNVDSFNLDRSITDGVEYPKVRAQKVKIDWTPYSDSMYIAYDETENVPFKFFDKGEHTLSDGGIILTPGGLYGEGLFEWDEATLKSNPGHKFHFGSNSLNTTSAEVSINAKGTNQFAFQNNAVEASVDFDRMVGDFISIDKDLSSDLPYNSYKTSLDQFHWDMKGEMIQIQSSQGKAGFFLATEETYDSLFFLGERADYTLSTGLLQIYGVDYIHVADAMIYPHDGYIEIEEKASMKTLDNAKIVADTSNRNHLIQRAKVNINSRREYTADTGYLEFNVEGRDQEILFNNIRVEEVSFNNYVTKGSGDIEEQQNFFLDKKTNFKGKVHLSAESKDLRFQGFARINSNVIPTREWFDVDSRVDKKNVAITYDVPRNPNGEALHVGLFFNADSAIVYTALLSPKKDDTDRSVFSARGVLKYDPKEEMFSFGDSARILGEAKEGKIMTVSEKTGKVTAEGRFDFNAGFNRGGMPTFLVDVLGDFNYFLGKSDFEFQTVCNLDFPLPDPIRDFIVADLLKNPEAAENILYNSIGRGARLRRALKEMVGDDKKLERTVKKLDEDSKLNLPSDFAHTFFFSHMTLAWSNKTSSFVSKNALELASIGGKHIGQVLKGYFEVQMDPTLGDLLNFMIISPNNDTYYYFSYKGGILKTQSNAPEYPAIIATLKRKDKKLKTANGLSIELELASPAEVDNFRNRARNAY